MSDDPGYEVGGPGDPRYAGLNRAQRRKAFATEIKAERKAERKLRRKDASSPKK